MNIAATQKKLILLGFIIVPFLSIGELINLFSGTASLIGNATGLFKASKDIIFILLIILGGLGYLASLKTNLKIFFYAYCVLVTAIPSIAMSMGNDFYYTASGLRWLIPIILPLFILKTVDSEFMKEASTYLLVLLLLHFAAQVLESIFAPSFFGRSSLGINLRNPGLFIIPNTGAFFTIISLYTVLFFSDMAERKKFIIVMVSVLSVLLAMSTTGIIVLPVLLFLYYFRSKYIKHLPILIVFTVILATSLLIGSAERSDADVSGRNRVEIFTENFSNARVFSDLFGYGTNTALIIAKDAWGMDSTYASLVVNLGYWGFIIFMSLLISGIFYTALSKNREMLTIFIIIALFSATTIIYEVYPANLIFSLTVAYFLNSRRPSNV